MPVGKEPASDQRRTETGPSVRGRTRREVLYGLAAAAGSVVLAACSSQSSGSGADTAGSKDDTDSTAGSMKPHIGGTSGSARKPLPTPADLHEAPALSGHGLPALKDRLPESPLVIPHNWVQRGKYGGSLNVPAFGTTGMANAAFGSFFYGSSPLRWLNDGLDIGPGIADRWSSNKDASKWTIRFRKGLKWSDGHPFTVDDVLFWWEDMVLPGHDALVPPPECLSATRHACTMSKVDDQTLRVSYDAPQPLLPIYLASYAKGGTNNPAWMYPKHYMKQFHPKYTKSVPKDWDVTGGLWEQKANWLRNPDCPTLTGYRSRSFDNNKGVTLERNPYYYVVSKDGDQLPYIDTVNVTLYQDAQVIKLQVQQGKMDYTHGQAVQISLADVSTLARNKDAGHYQILMWDSGSGTASIFFLNYDYPEKKYRDLFRDKRFRQAISHCYDRETARKSLYFQTGETTTGTMGPKAPEYHSGSTGPKIYRQWQDSYKALDPKKATSLLADLGLKDADGDGYLEFPDGSKLTIEIPYSADIPDLEAAKDDQLVSDAKKVGLRMIRRPVPPQAYLDQWASGQLMSRTNWEVSNGTIMQQAMWLLPLENSRWAPLEGSYYSSLSTGKQDSEQDLSPWKRHPPRMAPEPGGPIDRMWKLYEQAKRSPDQTERDRLVWKIIGIHITDGPFFMGTIADYPQPIIVDNDLRNVPSADNLAQRGIVNPTAFVCPGAYDPEVFFWTNPEEHSA